jgi:hypothetical protein
MSSDKKYLRGPDGFIYDWNAHLAREVGMEVVTEEEAFPENFIPKSQKGRKSKVDVGDLTVEEPPTTSDELNLEASRGL